MTGTALEVTTLAYMLFKPRPSHSAVFTLCELGRVSWRVETTFLAVMSCRSFCNLEPALACYALGGRRAEECLGSACFTSSHVLAFCNSEAFSVAFKMAFRIVRVYSEKLQTVLKLICNPYTHFHVDLRLGLGVRSDCEYMSVKITLVNICAWPIDVTER